MTDKIFEHFEKLLLRGVAAAVPAGGGFITQQIENISGVKREFTGTGVYSTFQIGNTLEAPERLPSNQPLNVVWLNKVSFLENGASVVLFVRDGLIDMLEIAAHGETWPIEKIPQTFSLEAVVPSEG